MLINSLQSKQEYFLFFSVLLCLAPGVCIVFCRRLSLIAICWLGDASQDIDLQLSLIISGQILPSACCMLETRAYPISRIHPVDLHCTAVPTKYNSYWTQVLNRNQEYLLKIYPRANINAIIDFNLNFWALQLRLP